MQLRHANYTTEIQFLWLVFLLISAIKPSRYRNSHPKVFCKKSALNNFPKLTGKHLCRSLFQVSSLQRNKKTPAKLFSYEFCKNFKNKHQFCRASVSSCLKMMSLLIPSSSKQIRLAHFNKVPCFKPKTHFYITHFFTILSLKNKLHRNSINLKNSD